MTTLAIIHREQELRAAEVASLRGAHVTMVHEGRTLLGEVVGSHGACLIVRHFNGKPWPVQPRPDEVTVLERTYCEEGE